MADEQVQQQFAMQRIYTKDISFESPATPGVFRQQWKPAVNVDLNTKSEKIDDNGNFEVVLSITITARLEEETAFLVEVQQAGIFLVQGIFQFLMAIQLRGESGWVWLMISGILSATAPGV